MFCGQDYTDTNNSEFNGVPAQISKNYQVLNTEFLKHSAKTCKYGFIY